jgi:hypothetical protein
MPGPRNGAADRQLRNIALGYKTFELFCGYNLCYMVMLFLKFNVLYFYIGTFLKYVCSAQYGCFL